MAAAAATVPTRRRRSRRPRTASSVVAGVLRYTALTAATVLFLIPFYLIVRNSLSLDTEITSPTWTFFPATVHWENFRELFTDPVVNIIRSLINSAVIAVVQTAGQLLLASMAGYGLARIPYRYATPIFYAILVTLMVPPAVTFIPSFILVSELRWVDTLQGIIVPVMFSGFTAFLFRQYFLNFPRELEDAARVDGLGYFGAYWRDRGSQLGCLLRSDRRDHVHRQLERVPVATGHRPRPVDVDGAGLTVDSADCPDDQPARAVPGFGGDDRAAGARVRLSAALPRAGRGRDRDQGVTADPSAGCTRSHSS